MTDAARAPEPATPLLTDLLPCCAAAAGAAAALVATARARLAARLVSAGRISNAALEADQFAAHGLAWMATAAESLRELVAWAGALDAAGGFGETERLILQIGFGEYLAQLAGGIPMSQLEIVRPHDVGLGAEALAAFRTPEVSRLIVEGNTDAARARLVALMLEGSGAATFGATGLDGDDEMIRDQFRRFADDRIAPHAHGWHLRDELIPIGDRRGDGRARGVRADHPGGIRRLRSLEDRDVRRLRGAVARLHRRGLARHPLGNRRGADPRRRHRGAEGRVAAAARERRGAADRGLHRARHRLGPRQPAHPGGARRRRLRRHRQQDLDHPRRAHRSDDHAGAHRPRDHRPHRPLDAAGAEAARHRGRALPGGGHDRRRDRRARLPRHEGIRARLRRLPRAGRRASSAASRGRASGS